MDQHAVLLVENESVPTDRRVWNQACVLRDAGYRITVVCPVGIERDLETEVQLDGITIRRFPLRRATNGFADLGRDDLHVAFVGDGAALEDCKKLLALAKNIARIVDEPELRRRLGEAALQRNGGLLSFETARDELLATYRTLENQVA